MDSNTEQQATPDQQLITQQEIPVEYPLLAERFKAMLVDAFLILFAMVLVSLLFSVFENAPGFVRGAVFILLIFLYDPLFVSFGGGTIGHRAMGLKVKSHSDRNRNVFLPLAILRFIVRWFLGWISFVTMISDKEKRAIHDLLCNSIVLYREKV